MDKHWKTIRTPSEHQREQEGNEGRRRNWTFHVFALSDVCVSYWNRLLHVFLIEQCVIDAQDNPVK